MFKILREDTLKVIFHSDICSAADPASKKKHVDPMNADVPHRLLSQLLSKGYVALILCH